VVGVGAVGVALRPAAWFVSHIAPVRDHPFTATAALNQANSRIRHGPRAACARVGVWLGAVSEITKQILLFIFVTFYRFFAFLVSPLDLAFQCLRELALGNARSSGRL
jgi:hypothetical protein